MQRNGSVAVVPTHPLDALPVLPAGVTTGYFVGDVPPSCDGKCTEPQPAANASAAVQDPVTMAHLKKLVDNLYTNDGSADEAQENPLSCAGNRCDSGAAASHARSLARGDNYDLLADELNDSQILRQLMATDCAPRMNDSGVSAPLSPRDARRASAVSVSAPVCPAPASHSPSSLADERQPLASQGSAASTPDVFAQRVSVHLMRHEKPEGMHCHQQHRRGDSGRAPLLAPRSASPASTQARHAYRPLSPDAAAAHRDALSLANLKRHQHALGAPTRAGQTESRTSLSFVSDTALPGLQRCTPHAPARRSGGAGVVGVLSTTAVPPSLPERPARVMNRCNFLGLKDVVDAVAATSREEIATAGASPVPPHPSARPALYMEAPCCISGGSSPHALFRDEHGVLQPVALSPPFTQQEALSIAAAMTDASLSKSLDCAAALERSGTVTSSAPPAPNSVSAPHSSQSSRVSKFLGERDESVLWLSTMHIYPPAHTPPAASSSANDSFTPPVIAVDPLEHKIKRWGADEGCCLHPPSLSTNSSFATGTVAAPGAPSQRPDLVRVVHHDGAETHSVLRINLSGGAYIVCTDMDDELHRVQDLDRWARRAPSSGPFALDTEINT